MVALKRDYAPFTTACIQRFRNPRDCC